MRDIRICPVCKRKYQTQSLFKQTGSRLVCPRGHSYDLSAGGYVNLLPPSAGAHGDNRTMVRARRDLLNTGIYAPLRCALTEELMMLDDHAVIWDSGCGEGYYTSAAASCEKDFQIYGSDLSSAALIEAHKRCPSLILTAASSYALPAADQSCDCLICLFAPEAMDEFRRVLKPNGKLILGIPGKRHLFGLKKVLYSTPYENSPRDPSLDGFELIRSEEIYYSVTIDDPEQIQSLFEMTPYAYRTGAIGKEQLLTLKSLETELHFHLYVYSFSQNS